MKKSNTTSVDSQTTANSHGSVNNSLCKCEIIKKLLKLNYYKTNSSIIVFIILYFLIQSVLIIVQLQKFKNESIAVMIARSAGILLSFNMVLTLIFVLKKTWTCLSRSRLIRFCLPIDNFVMFHRYIGALIVILGLLHVSAHCVNLYFVSTKPLNESNQTNSSEKYNEMKPSITDYFFGTAIRLGLIRGAAIPTGWALVLIMAIMFVFSISRIRKHFYRIFFNTHRLYIIVYILTVLHCENFWKWFIGPFFLAFIDNLVRYYQTKASNYGSTYIKHVYLLPSNVIQLVIKRPEKFEFKAGDYVLVKIPFISIQEYHPFTISSCPENKDEIWLHIRMKKNWTKKLVEYFTLFAEHGYYKPLRKKRLLENCFRLVEEPRSFDEVQVTKIKRIHSADLDSFKLQNIEINVISSENTQANNVPNKSRLSFIPGSWISNQPNPRDLCQELQEVVINDIESIEQANKTLTKNRSSQSERTIVVYSLIKSEKLENVNLKIRVDGPFGTASRHVFHAEHVILVASGIGITPFASILQSMWKQHVNCMNECLHCSQTTLVNPGVKKLRKVDFVWVNRDYTSFEWFMDLLVELELQQIISTKKFIDFHLYCTDKKMDQSLVLKELTRMASNICDLEKRKKAEAMLKQIQRGRPKFDKLFEEISKNKEGNIEVFLCGNKQIGNTLQNLCIKHGFKYSQENFD